MFIYISISDTINIFYYIRHFKPYKNVGKSNFGRVHTFLKFETYFDNCTHLCPVINDWIRVRRLCIYILMHMRIFMFT